MPGSARAQLLYVSQLDNYNTSVGEYNATTGATINTGFIASGNPRGLVLSDNTLFVATGFSMVGKYNATTGAPINSNFITGLLFPWALALSSNNLFVANSGDTVAPGTVGEYNATTGAAINPNFITGLGGPTGLALSGNNLFVTDNAGSRVGEYNATTGAEINANFITGLVSPSGLAVRPASVPEPSTWVMIAIGGAALLGIMHRKKHRTA